MSSNGKHLLETAHDECNKRTLSQIDRQFSIKLCAFATNKRLSKAYTLISRIDCGSDGKQDRFK